MAHPVSRWILVALRHICKGLSFESIIISLMYLGFNWTGYLLLYFVPICLFWLNSLYLNSSEVESRTHSSQLESRRLTYTSRKNNCKLNFSGKVTPPPIRISRHTVHKVHIVPRTISRISDSEVGKLKISAKSNLFHILKEIGLAELENRKHRIGCLFYL